MNLLSLLKLFFLSLFSATFALAAQADTILNNDLMRFGNGAEASINPDGTLKFPYYYRSSDTTWYQLVYGSHADALDQSFGIGGDGTNQWNRNGTLAHNPTLSGISFDASGITYSSGDVGTGSLVATGTHAVGGVVLDVEYTYELEPSNNYVKVTMKITNNTASAVSNLRYWVGTNDDYIGGDDRPRIQRGNIDTGSFVQSSATTDRSPATLITSGSEGVLMYAAGSTTDSLNTPANPAFRVR